MLGPSDFIPCLLFLNSIYHRALPPPGERLEVVLPTIPRGPNRKTIKGETMCLQRYAKILPPPLTHSPTHSHSLPPGQMTVTPYWIMLTLSHYCTTLTHQISLPPSYLCYLNEGSSLLLTPSALSPPASKPLSLYAPLNSTPHHSYTHTHLSRRFYIHFAGNISSFLSSLPPYFPSVVRPCPLLWVCYAAM